MRLLALERKLKINDGDDDDENGDDNMEEKKNEGIDSNETGN